MLNNANLRSAALIVGLAATIGSVITLGLTSFGFGVEVPNERLKVLESNQVSMGSDLDTLRVKHEFLSQNTRLIIARIDTAEAERDWLRALIEPMATMSCLQGNRDMLQIARMPCRRLLDASGR